MADGATEADAPRKRSDAQRNEASLLAAAAAAFVASGVDAPVRDIAARAGVGLLDGEAGAEQDAQGPAHRLLGDPGQHRQVAQPRRAAAQDAEQVGDGDDYVDAPVVVFKRDGGFQPNGI